MGRNVVLQAPAAEAKQEDCQHTGAHRAEPPLLRGTEPGLSALGAALPKVPL